MLVEFKNLYLDDLEKLKTEISAFSSYEDLVKVQRDITNSPGNLCLHLCGNLQHYIGATLGNTGYIRNRDFEFSSKNYTKKILLQEIDKTIEAINFTFSKLKETDLAKLYPETPHWKGYSVELVLITCANHFSYHLGQINYHRRLLTLKNKLKILKFNFRVLIL